MLWRNSRNFSPPVDLIETPEEIVVMIEVAGMRAEDFNITVGSGSLVITGVRRRPILDSPAYHRVEIGFGEFRIEIPLPWSLQYDFVNANYQDGFLQISLPRIPEQQIPIMTLDEEQDDE